MDSNPNNQAAGPGGFTQSPADMPIRNPPVEAPESYFDSGSSASGIRQQPQSATGSGGDAANILRELGLGATVDSDAAVFNDPKKRFSSLELSGNIISAAICLPHIIALHNEKWSLTRRQGTSTLFDSFSFLSGQSSPWKHTVVGWTGKIRPVAEKPRRGSMLTDPGLAASNHRQMTDTSNARIPQTPVHSNGDAKKAKHVLPSGAVQVSAAQRTELEQLLLNDTTCRSVPVWLYDEKEEGKDPIVFSDQARWRRYAERELYTLFHYKTQDYADGKDERKTFADFVRLNQKFAERILQIYTPGDVVWIHDYHLTLLPSLLRQRVPNMYIGFFFHVPFPSSEYMRCLSQRKQVLEGVLGANLLGFQTREHARHFSSCATRILGFHSTPEGVDAYGAHIAMDVFPIGIDARRVACEALADPGVATTIKRIRQHYPNVKIIVGRDRLDSVRGVAQKLQAYERFLERYPNWRGKVVLIQVTSPTSLEEEKEDPDDRIAGKVANLVTKINSRFGGLEYEPVLHFSKYIAETEYFALLRLADLGLITSVRDGMNTTSLEFVLCQHERHSPLILSEFSGTATLLQEALQINPWDLTGVARAINKALSMSPEEQITQHQALSRRVTTNTVQRWSQCYLTRLMETLTAFTQAIATPVLDKRLLLSRYKRAQRRLFMFDYDGTLTPIVRDPAAAIPSDRILRTIKTLAADKRNSVWIISGRDQAFLDEWMSHISELGLSAEHGSFVRLPEADDWENLAAKLDMSWQSEVLEVFQRYADRTQGSFVERKRIALTWHFRRADPEYGAYQAARCKAELESSLTKRFGLEVMDGKANLEVRPAFVNKGEIAKRLISEYVPTPASSPTAASNTQPRSSVIKTDGAAQSSLASTLAGAASTGKNSSASQADQSRSSENVRPEHNRAMESSGSADAIKADPSDANNQKPQGSALTNGTQGRPVREPAASSSSHSTGPDFVFCTGDDFTDEDMFRALEASALPPETVFTVTVGARSKKTAARWHLLEPADVIATVALLNGSVSADEIERAQKAGGGTAAGATLKF